MKRAALIHYSDNRTPTIKIVFDFDWSTVMRVKQLPGRKYHGRIKEKEKYWTCPLTIEAAEMLQEGEFELSQELLAFLEKSRVTPATQIEAIEVPGLKMELFPFQKQGVAFVEAKNGRALIADQMGLGKTIQSLAWTQLHPELRPVIIVVPASVKLNWSKEIKRWLPKPRIQILYGTTPNKKLNKDFIIINYDILPHWLEHLKQINAPILITDECHYYKSNKAQRTRAVKKLARRIPHMLALSGTPALSRPIEMYNALKLIDPTVVSNRMDFAMRYCAAWHNGFGWNFNGASNTKELHEKLTTTIMIRRKKSEVLKELPPKIRSYIPLELDNKEEYQEAEEDFINWLSKTRGMDAARKASNAETFVKIEMLKQIAVKGKLKQAISWVDDFLSSDEKLVVFTTHKFTINELMNKYKKIAVRLDGSVPIITRQKRIEQFQTNDRIRLLVGNIKVAGVGITLTVASNTAFVELGWTPGEHDQAEDRVHRIGQEADSITAYYLLAAETIEEKIAKLIDRKRRVLDMVLDGKETEKGSLLGELIKGYKKN